MINEEEENSHGEDNESGITLLDTESEGSDDEMGKNNFYNVIFL